MVWVAAGVYYGNNSPDASGAFSMMDGINVYGGFAGNEPSDFDLSLRNFDKNETVLDGQNARRVLIQDSTFSNCTVWDGFTIQNGNTSGQYGSGAFLINNTTLNNCTFKNNSSSSLGFRGSAVVNILPLDVYKRTL